MCWLSQSNRLGRGARGTGLGLSNVATCIWIHPRSALFPPKKWVASLRLKHRIPVMQSSGIAPQRPRCAAMCRCRADVRSYAQGVYFFACTLTRLEGNQMEGTDPSIVTRAFWLAVAQVEARPAACWQLLIAVTFKRLSCLTARRRSRPAADLGGYRLHWRIAVVCADFVMGGLHKPPWRTAPMHARPRTSTEKDASLRLARKASPARQPGSGPRYMIRVTFRVQFSHVREFSDSRNVQKRATKSDTSGHCLDIMDL